MKKDIQIFVPTTLGMLTAFGPFVTDFYLPVLPEMAGYFNTTASNASLSLTMGMIGLAIGQIFIGPLTDKYGRKNILVASMLLFSLSSIFCILTSDIIMFNAMRLLQGVAGAGGIVISKSIATDMYSGSQLASFMAILAAINGIAPVCAPVIGGLMAGIASWQGVFGILLAVGIVLVICSAFLSETLLPKMRIHKGLIHVYANLFHVFRNRCFALCVLSTMFCFFAFFGYIASSPFILQARIWAFTVPFQPLFRHQRAHDWRGFGRFNTLQAPIDKPEAWGSSPFSVVHCHICLPDSSLSIACLDGNIHLHDGCFRPYAAVINCHRLR